MAQRSKQKRWGSGVLMTVGVLVAFLGVMGPGATSSATDTPAAETGDWQPKPTEPETSVPDVTVPVNPVPSVDPKPTLPETTQPETTQPAPTLPTPTLPTSASTTAKARVSCADGAILIDLMNTGETTGTYTVTFTPDNGTASTKVVTVTPGVDRSTSMPIAAGTSGTLDIRSSSEVVMDARRFTSKCAAPRGTAEARADCAAKQLVVTVRNDGDAAGTYTVTFTPDGLDAVTREVAVPAGQTIAEAITTQTPIRGVLDVRSPSEVLIDHRQIDEPCSAPKTTGDARFDCAASQLVVTLRNNGTASGTYTLTYTPDGGSAATTNAVVPAQSEAVFALAVSPPRGGRLDVRSSTEVVIGGRRIEVNCATTTTAAPTTVAPSTAPPTTVAATVAPVTSIRVIEQPEMLATTGSNSSLPLIAIGVSLFMLGLITLELRTATTASTTRRQ